MNQRNRSIGAFGAAVRRLREEAGFPTAYRFYHQNGGRRHFPFTYSHYLRVEQGASLPAARAVPLIVAALRLSPGPDGMRTLMTAYLRDLLGSEEAFDTMLRPLLCDHHAVPGDRPALAVLRGLRARTVAHLSFEQFKAVAADPAAYWCSEILLNDRGSWTPEDISRTLDMSPGDARRGLSRLEEAGLARRTRSGRFANRNPGKFFTFPGRLQGLNGQLQAVRGHWERMYAGKGKELWERLELVRARESAMLPFVQALSESVESAHALGSQTQEDDTGLFLIEARVRRLMRF